MLLQIIIFGALLFSFRAYVKLYRIATSHHISISQSLRVIAANVIPKDKVLEQMEKQAAQNRAAHEMTPDERLKFEENIQEVENRLRSEAGML